MYVLIYVGRRQLLLGYNLFADFSLRISCKADVPERDDYRGCNRSTSVFSALEVFNVNALYKFTFDICPIRATFSGLQRQFSKWCKYEFFSFIWGGVRDSCAA